MAGEYVHIENFLKSVPFILGLKKASESRQPEVSMSKFGQSISQIDTMAEKGHIIAKMKAILRERGVTIWESLLSCSISVVQKNKIKRDDLLRMMKVMNLDLTMREKSLLMKVLDPEEQGMFDLNNLLKTLEGQLPAQNPVGQGLLTEKIVYGLYYAGYGVGEAFDFIDVDKKGTISDNEFIYGISKLNLDLSVFEIQQILSVIGLSRFDRLTRGEFKATFKRLMRKNQINPLLNFSISLLARIKNLIHSKQRNLLESFIDEDPYKTGYADIEMLKKSLMKFGLSNIKIHEIKTLLKMFKSDAARGGALAQARGDLSAKHDGAKPTDDFGYSREAKSSRDSSLGGLKGTDADMTLELDFDKGLEIGGARKKKQFDIEDPNFKISYQEFTDKIYEEIENNSKLAIDSSFEVLRKIHMLLKLKRLSLFEAFVYFDVNSQNKISNMELRLGLQNLDIVLERFEFSQLWNIIEKIRGNKISYSYFLQAFLNAGCIEIIKFDDKTTRMIKRFTFLITKQGSSEELFRKFDRSSNGYVTFSEFKELGYKMHLGFREEELESIFKIFCNPDELRHGKFIKRADIAKNQKTLANPEENQNVNPTRVFNFKKFVSVVTFFRNKDHVYEILAKLDLALKEKNLTYKDMLNNYAGKTSDDHKSKKAPKKAGTDRRGGAKPQASKQPNIQEIHVTELKRILRGLELGLTYDELNTLVDAYEVDKVGLYTMESMGAAAVKKIDQSKSEKTNIFAKIISEIQQALLKEHVTLERVFFDFDSRSDGTLLLEEFHSMLSFLKIRCTKKETKLIFDDIDFGGKGQITYKEFLNFYDSSLFGANSQSKGQKSEEKSQLENIVRILQDSAISYNTSLEKLITSAN